MKAPLLRAIRILPGLIVLLLFLVDSPVEGQDSLWKRGGEGKRRKSIYLKKPTKRPDIEKNDIVLVLVSEHSVARNTGNLDARRKLEVQMLIDEWVQFDGFGLEKARAPHPEIDVEVNRNLQARAKTDRTETFRLRIAATVVDKLPNGNLVIEARKERRVNDEQTTMKLSGIIRSTDVAVDYSIVSDRIAEMKLSYTGKGPISRNSGWTWLTWLIDHVWPF